MRRLSMTLTRLAAPAVIGALVLLAVAPAAHAAAPMLIRDINPTGSSNPSSLTAVGSTLFFAANDGIHGNELWKSDGTAAGTKMVRDIRPLGKSSDPADLVNVNGRLFFTAIDGIHGRELWKSDGTKAGTVMVKDLNPGPAGQYGGNSTYIHERAFAIGSRLIFMRDTCCVGTQELVVSDGTAAGTKTILPDAYWEMPEKFGVGVADGRFYFVTVAPDAGSAFVQQLWVSDGTAAGTHRVAGSPNAAAMSIFPTNGSKLYFYTGRVWRTNGTAAGTLPLTAVGLPNQAPTESVALNSRLYFNGSGLWKTDGTPSGTKKISNGDVAWLTKAGGKLFFSRNENLLKSDGTAAGTTDIGPMGVYGPSHLIAVGTELCFAAVGNDDWALWKSNGTAAGTYQVRSFVGAPEVINQAAFGAKLFFAADEGVHGTELWRYTP